MKLSIIEHGINFFKVLYLSPRNIRMVKPCVSGCKGDSVKRYFSSEHTTYESMMYTMFEKVVFTGDYGTKEIVDSGNKTHINNVADAELELRNIISNKMVEADNDKHCKKNTKLYTLHVYADGKTKMRVE
jgi:hypothetical protein